MYICIYIYLYNIYLYLYFNIIYNIYVYKLYINENLLVKSDLILTVVSSPMFCPIAFSILSLFYQTELEILVRFM